MAEKIKTCGKRRINGDHNVGYDVGLNIVVYNVGLRSGDVALSCSNGVGLERNNSNIGSSSSRVITNNTGIFGLE